MIAAGWLIALLGAIFTAQNLIAPLTLWLGLLPRDASHLHGILTAHLAHGSWPHLLANALALLITIPACRFVAPNLALGAGMVSGLAAGALTWCIGTPGTLHVGISGVIFGLVGFLITAALVRREWRAVLIGVGISLLYGGSLLLALPGEATQGQRISWEMHLGGLIGGAGFAIATRAVKREKS